ncbi:MAG: hypothetical protein Ta2E_09290 [Mycoplasmoidaceae bacterium]|nr:MAG: hypothetical protein Ta2E_09290 [Mycoplasmoidaceae bacterium]
MKEIYNKAKIKEIIRTRGNHSAPGTDELTNPILKIERELQLKWGLELWD